MMENLVNLAIGCGTRSKNSGYFRARVPEPNATILDFTRHPQPVALNVRFTEGSRYKVREIQWSGIKAITMDEILPISQVYPEDVLDTSKIRETLEAMRRLYFAIGYPAASIVPEFQVHEAGHWVILHFTVLEGAQSP